MEGSVNLVAAWIGILLGLLSGILPGLLFRKSGWLGGYASWERRLIRLGHISFFGIAFLNLSFAFTMQSFAVDEGMGIASLLLLVGAISMPSICYLSAWKPLIRHLFFIPVTSLIIATLLTLQKILA